MKKNSFIIIPDGEDCYEWWGLIEIFCQMGDSKPSEEVFVNEACAIETLMPKWDISMGTLHLNNMLICDIWGILVPWKSIGTVLSKKFRNHGEKEFLMKPMGLPANGLFLKLGVHWR